MPTGGSIPEGTSAVAAPGMGSLSVTGPTGRGGAKPETRLRSVTSEHLRPPTSEVKSGIHGMTGGEVLSPEDRNQPVSGSTVVRRSAIRVLKDKRTPQAWRQAKIIAIPKPGKDHSIAANYQPMSLLRMFQVLRASATPPY